VLAHVYRTALDSALESFKFPDGTAGPALRAAYLVDTENQDLFDFVVCSSLLAFFEKGFNLTENEDLRFNVNENILTQIAVGQAFMKLRDTVQAIDEEALYSEEGASYPLWIKDSVDAFGKETFHSWLEGQVFGIKCLVEHFAGDTPFNDLSAYEDALDYGAKQPTLFVQAAETPKKAAEFEIFDYSDADLDTSNEKLDTMIGLKNVKKKAKTMLTRMVYNKVREKVCSQKSKPSFKNMIFIGSPGVGKTTVARYMGEIMAAGDVLPNKQVVFCSGGELIGDHIGFTEKKIRDLFEAGRGGLIVIDEADALAQTDSTTFHRSAIDMLNSCLGNEKDNDTGTIVIMTGYPNGIAELLRRNPGLSRRFPVRYEFYDYTDSELTDICVAMIKARDYTIDPEAVPLFTKQILEAKKYYGATFGNAGTIETMIEAMEDARADDIGLLSLYKMLSDGTPTEEDLHKMSRLGVKDVPIFSDGGFFNVKPERPQQKRADISPEAMYV
ncbi:MAG: AAA family ATPase, partial [Alphaproteobacteria bacterium]|nr:AAA family ATPase [Alphaproteobacteria bacterium]